jgi:NADPH-dependent ferric siderophore reductase
MRYISCCVSQLAAAQQVLRGDRAADPAAINALEHLHHNHHHTHISRLDVRCDSAGMSVSLDFDGPFSGVVYSKGHFNNPKCR